MADQESKAPENPQEGGGAAGDEPRRRRRRPKKERLMSSTGVTIFVMINGFIVIIASVMLLGGVIVKYSSRQMEDQLKPLYAALSEAVHEAHMPEFRLYTDMPERVALGFLVSGIALFIIAFIGCCASANQNRSLLIFYGIFLGVVLVIQGILMILLFSVKKELNESMKQPMLDNIKTHYRGTGGKNDVATFGWNFIMATFQCCGVDNYTDMHRASLWDRRVIMNGYQYLKEIPESCCLKEVDIMQNKKLTNVRDKNCTIHPTPYNAYINKPCWPSIQHALADQSALMMSVGVCVFGFLILLLAVSLLEWNAGTFTKNKDKEDEPAKNRRHSWNSLKNIDLSGCNKYIPVQQCAKETKKINQYGLETLL